MADIEIPRHGQLTLLGSIIRCDGNMSHEVASRIAKGWTYYHTFRYIFENKFVSVKMRILVWEKTVMMVLLWGLETASLTKTLRRNLDRCQHQMFSRMAKMKRHWSANEPWLDFEKRKVRMGRYLVQKHSILLSDRLLSKVFSWAGHVARMSPDKWALRTTLWNGCCWKQSGKHKPAWNNYDVQHRYALT